MGSGLRQAADGLPPARVPCTVCVLRDHDQQRVEGGLRSSPTECSGDNEARKGQCGHRSRAWCQGGGCRWRRQVGGRSPVRPAALWLGEGKAGPPDAHVPWPQAGTGQQDRTVSCPLLLPCDGDSILGHIEVRRLSTFSSCLSVCPCRLPGWQPPPGAPRFLGCVRGPFFRSFWAERSDILEGSSSGRFQGLCKAKGRQEPTVLSLCPVRL